MIYTFYSYKGGVGRSMAMANVAEWFYLQGLRVIVIDWDLEAPGLESFFYESEKEIAVARSQLGLIDLLMAYKRIFTRLRTPQSDLEAKEIAGSRREEHSQPATPPDWLQVLRDNLPPISDTLYPLHAPDEESKGKGALYLISAGWRSGDRFPVYAESVQSFDWSDFYASFEGESFFDWLREQLVKDDLADLVLIDSRTGVTEMGGVCTRQMADVVVSFCVPNSQNLEGVYAMTKSFNREELVTKRKRALQMVVIPSRLDISEVDDRKVFEDQFRKKLDEFTPEAFKSVDSCFWDLQIQYVPKYAYREGLAITDSRVPELTKAYKKLTVHLALLAQGVSGERVRAKCADELQREFASHLPGLYQLTEEEQARYLQLAVFPDDAAIALADVQQLWQLDEGDTEKLIQRLAGISLLKYEPHQQILRLNSVVRAKLLEQMPNQEALNETIETAFARLAAVEQAMASRIFTRLVRLVTPDDSGDDIRQRVRISEFEPFSQAVIESLAKCGLVTIEEKGTREAGVQIANEAYLTGWERLVNWIKDDRDFLLWRQQLKSKIAEWEATKRDQGALLSGIPLLLAVERRNARENDLNEAETYYIDESQRAAERIKSLLMQTVIKERNQRRWLAITVALAFIVLTVTAIVIVQRTRRQGEVAENARQAEKLNSSGLVELTNKNYDLAISDFTRAINTKSDYAEAYLNRARAYRHSSGEKGKELAIADYGQAIQLKPDLAVAYFERGDLYSQNINDELAVSDYTSAIKIKPDYWDAYLNRGFTLENQDRFEAAVLDYTQIINSDSTELKPTAYLRRGSTYLSMKDKEHATTDLLKAIALTLNPAVRTPATSALYSLGYLPLRETQPPATFNIFLQYSDSKDAPVINDISKSLEDSGYNVEAKELIVTQTGGEVLYYSLAPETKASAEKIRDVVAQTLADKSKLKLDLAVSYKGKDAPYVPRDNIEVWLPPLQKLVQLPKK